MTRAPRRAGRRVGLLGGSFNPAHEGHLHISRLALDHLGLDELWWLVSPQNPLKPAHGMATFGERLAGARAMAGDRRIVVSDLERRLGTRYTADTLRALRVRFPYVAFVWVMGADNLAQISRWKDWMAIFEAVPIAVFDRPSYSDGALVCEAARRLARFRLDPRHGRRLAGCEPPAWMFVQGELNAISASGIRKDKMTRPKLTPRTDAKEQPIAKSPKTSSKSYPEVSRLLALVEASLEDGKAEDVIVVALEGKSTIADYMVIATGRSHRQVGALAENLIRKIKAAKFGTPGVEGRTQGDWVLLDAGDVIVHLFRPEVRSFYNLEKMWAAELPGGEESMALPA